MHMQAGTPGWLEALVLMPDWSLVKAFDPSMLVEAKLVWMAAGRPAERLVTCVRHADFDMVVGATVGEIRDGWRANFFRIVDRTYLERYAWAIDLIEEANEYTATSTWTSQVETNKCLQSMYAAAYVWNNEFRGRTVESHDGGEGHIRSDCRLVLCNSPVSNRIHREYYKVALDYDNAVGSHPYSHYYRGVRSPWDWAEHSGLWNVEEQEHGLFPLHVLGEAGPYVGVDEGWRHPDVLMGNVSLLKGAWRQWFRDAAGTPAYREGRVLTPAQFTSGDIHWPWYQMRRDELLMYAEVAREEWHPGPGQWPGKHAGAGVVDPDPIELEDTMAGVHPVIKAKVREHLGAIDVLLDKDWWSVYPVPFVVGAAGASLPLFRAPGPTPLETRAGVTYDIVVRETMKIGEVGWLRVAPPPGTLALWVKADDVVFRRAVP